MHENAATRLAVLALAGGAIGIGFAPVLVRLSETGPSATAFYRVLFALPLLWVWLSRETPRSAEDAPPRRPSQHFPQFALAGVLFAADLAFWHWSIQLTTIANATLLANTAPIFVTVGAAVLFHERISGRFILALALALCGAVLLVSASLSLSPRYFLGDALGVVAAVFYAAYMLSVKHLRAHFSAAAILGWSGLVSGPCLLVIAFFSKETLAASTAAGWLVLVALALISHVGGQTLIAYAFGHLKASFTSLGLLLQPVVAAILAWMIFGESLGLEQIIGGAVILGAIFLASRR
jgi:drug/metabolite transporter (DMT)-like permease